MITQIILILIVVALMIFLNALYVGAEFATVGSRKTRIRQLAANGDALAIRLLPILENNKLLDDYVATCQVGITVSSLVLAAYGERVVAPLLENAGLHNPTISSLTILFIFTILQVIFGELFPKSVAVQFPEKLALRLIWPMLWSQWIFRPLIWVSNGSAHLLLHLLGQKGNDAGHNQLRSPEEIEILVSESHEGGLLEDQEKLFLRNAFRLRSLTPRQVMVHRTRLVAADVKTPPFELLQLALAEGFTRIPVYQEIIDNIIGFVHVKDIFRVHINGSEDIGKIIRQVVYVPESIAAMDVWSQLNTQRQYMAVVFDEYGGTAGLITLEDLIEEIMGELQDEFDDESALVTVDQIGRIHLRADLLIKDINEYLNLDLPSENTDTIGGLVFSELGRRPKVGDEVEINGICIRVEKMDDVRVEEISIPHNTTTNFAQLGEWVVPNE